MDEEICLQIVGAEEVDIDRGLMSVSASLARALIGKEIGEEVQVRLPAGVRQYEIVDVRFE
jgi:transcription elongation factor GreA